MPIYKRNGSPFFWYRFKINNQEYRGTTGETDRQGAQAIERRIRAELEASAPPRGTQRRKLTLADLAGLDYERAVAKKRRAPTLRMIKQSWKTIITRLGDAPAESIDYAVANRYMAARQAEGGLRNQSLRRELTVLRRGLQLAIRNGALFRMPPDWPELESDEPNEAQRGKLHPKNVIAAWIAELTPDARDEAWFAVLTGLRYEEIKRVRLDWVVVAPPGIGVPALLELPPSGTKTRNGRTVGLTEAALAILRRRVAANPEGPFVFAKGSHKTTMRAAAARIGYAKRITMRDLRATYASLALEYGADPIAVQAALGHKQLSTTQRYLKSTLARTASASFLVGKALEQVSGWHIEGGTAGGGGMSTADLASDVAGLDGAKNRDRTDDLLITNQLQELLSHVSTCFYCQSTVASCTEMRRSGGSGWHSDGGTVPPDEEVAC